MTDRIAFAGPVTADGRRLKGSVILAGSRTWRNNEWLEVDPAAVVRADAADAFASWEHDDGKLLAATRNGTLHLTRTDQGFEYETEPLPDTSYANDALVLINGGYVTGTSFEIEGIRSKFSTDPDGTRVRRITSIQRFRAVNPVRDPAFTNSVVAAFSKEESSDMEPTIVEPTAPVAPAPVITFKDEKSETYRTAEAFARKQDLAGLEAAMENIVTGEMTPAKAEAYDAFAAVYDERKRLDNDAKERRERIQLAQDMRLGRIAKAPIARETVESEDYLHAFGKYLRTGDRYLMEQFAQSIAGDGSQGGYMVPDSFLTRVSDRKKAYGGIRQVSEVITTGDGQSLRWPSNDDTANSAAIVAEGVSGTAGADLVLGSVTLGAFSYSSNGTGNVPLKVSLELLQDAAFDVANFVSNKLGERIGRKQAVDLATGGGTTLPFGLFTKAADVMTATAVSLAAPEHILQVDSEYRDNGNCRWVMSDTTLQKVWQSQTTTNQPLFIPGGSDIVGAPGGRLFGYPIVIDPGAGTLVAFGDIRQGYIIRDVRQVEVLVDPYTYSSTRQIGYHAWARMDANIQDAYAFSVSEWSTVSADT